MPTIVCSRCRIEEDVGFEPSPDATMLCESCHAQIREEAQRVKDQRAREEGGPPAEAPRPPKKMAPRKKHGTRVFLPIVCTSCGKEETL
ncbi:MAG: hypothetical protein ACNA8W_21920, partial [Bradymonadaceae bacterium]